MQLWPFCWHSSYMVVPWWYREDWSYRAVCGCKQTTFGRGIQRLAFSDWHSAAGIQRLACSNRHSYDQPGRIMVMMGIITFRWLIFDVFSGFFNTLVVRTRLMAFNVKFNFTLFIMYAEYRNLAREHRWAYETQAAEFTRPFLSHSWAVPANFIWSHHVRSAKVPDLELDGNWKLLNKEECPRDALCILSTAALADERPVV